MKVTQAQVDGILEYLENMELDIDDRDFRKAYSGRGMHGQTCIGFVLQAAEHAMYLGAAIAEILGIEGVELIQRATQDDMGRGIIIYFPGVTLQD